MTVRLAPVAALAAVATLGIAASASSAQRTLAERLGRPADAKLLIVHADDLGEWHAVNAAFARAYAAGAVNSGVMMVPCPWFPEIAAWALEHPEADLGLHLTVTSERTANRWGPVASRDRVPSLLDAHGYLRRIQVEAAEVIDAREVEVELRAQVDRALAFGLKPTHLDSHQAVLYRRRDLFESLVRVSRAYGIPLGLARSHVANAPFMAEVLGADTLLVDRAFDIPPDVPAAQWSAWYAAEIRKLGPGVTELVVHPGLADAELRAATADRETWGAEWRQRDFDFLMSAEFRRLIAQTGIQLVTWRELGALARAESGR